MDLDNGHVITALEGHGHVIMLLQHYRPAAVATELQNQNQLVITDCWSNLRMPGYFTARSEFDTESQFTTLVAKVQTLIMIFWP